jgi:hypothetical protein
MSICGRIREYIDNSLTPSGVRKSGKMNKEKIIEYLSNPVQIDMNGVISTVISIPINSDKETDSIIRIVDELGYEYNEISIETNLIKFIKYEPLKLRRQSATSIDQ